MKLLDKIKSYAVDPIIADTDAFVNPVEHPTRITYRQLDEYSNNLANYITSVVEDDKSPIVVYGHKSPYMLAAFLGCVKSHHPYCPVDLSMPEERIRDIITLSKTKLYIKGTDAPFNEDSIRCVSYDELEDICQTKHQNKPKTQNTVDEDETYYIIFTSGSTGKPKGVEITANCLEYFVEWAVTLGDKEYFKPGRVFLNQAPFSFDLSVMDLYMSLYTAGRIWSLDKSVQNDSRKMLSLMRDSEVEVWVSTPSFANVCLASKNFNSDMLPKLRYFLFCGETLTNTTAAELRARFPSSTVINTYGPTESTVAITQVTIDDAINTKYSPLPVGYPKTGTGILIMDEKYSYPPLDDDIHGEIVITGDTLAKGYLNMPELTRDKFISIQTPTGNIRGYKTGDEGYLHEGLLFYCGRKDFQIKLHGFRIELGDIENNILGISNVVSCTVLPIEKKGEYTGLAAFLVMDTGIDDEFEFSLDIRETLSAKLPQYMVPKKYIFVDAMPMTTNGKINRGELRKMLEEKL